MVLTYIVELKTSATFTARKTVKSENEALRAVEKMRLKNKNENYSMYSGFKLYDQLNIVNKEPKLLNQWP